jgi:hypothetical protein
MVDVHVFSSSMLWPTGLGQRWEFQRHTSPDQ